MKPAHILQIPNDLQAKLGDTPLDGALLQKMEDALQTLSGEFPLWLADEVTRLQRAVRAARQTPGLESRRTLLKSCGDLKGMGTTCGYPLISRVASSACALLREESDLAEVLPLLEAHVAAITVLLDCQIRCESHEEGRLLASELECQTRLFSEQQLTL